MRRLLIGTLLGLLMLCGGLAWLLGQAVSTKPAVADAAHPTAQDLEQGRRIYRQLIPAQGLRDGQRILAVTSRDLELGLNYLISRFGQSRARVSLAGQHILVHASLNLPHPLQNHFLNAELGFAPSQEGLVPSRLRLGQVRLPMLLVRPVARELLKRSPYATHWAAMQGMLRQVEIHGGHVRLTLVWNAQTRQTALDAVRQLLVGVEAAQVQAYREHLVQLARTRPRPSFAAIVGTLLERAQERSAQSNPGAENRAMLIALAEAVNGVQLGMAPQGTASIPGLRLAGRGDFVEHFTLSAALAAVAGEDLADMAGLYKELRDTRGGSGFSFTDLAADRAGSRFGRLATQSEKSARRVQALLAGKADETAFIPPLRDLPEYLPEQVFVRRYGGVDGAEYKRLAAEIEARIAELPLYRDDTGPQG